MIKIIEDGMEFVMEECSFGLEECPEECKLKLCGDKNCEKTNPNVFAVCFYHAHGNDESYICTSAQKVTEEAKVYNATQTFEARKALEGKPFEGWSGMGWIRCRSLIVHTYTTQSPYNDKGSPMTFSLIRETEQRHLTWAQIKALHPDLEDVVLIEEEDNE